MQEPETVELIEFEWDEVNETHCARHGLTPVLVEAVKDGRPKIFRNKEGRTGTHMMIGADNEGRLWTMIMLPTGRPGIWRAITGWPSTNSEISLFERKTKP